VTAGLAWAGASRALGTAAAVTVAPALFDAAGVSLVCLCMAASCAVAACVGGVVVAIRRRRRGRLAESLDADETAVLRAELERVRADVAHLQEMLADALAVLTALTAEPAGEPRDSRVIQMPRRPRPVSEGRRPGRRARA
jgi:hypothetical protein